MILVSRLRYVASAVFAVTFAVAANHAQAGMTTAPDNWRPFAPDSVWNQQLRADRTISPDSAAGVDWLNRSIARDGTWINSSSCGVPIFWADEATATVPVTLAASAGGVPALRRAWAAVPIPDGAVPANCSDKNLAVLQRQPDGTVTQWEFWRAAQAADGTWSARWGGVTQDVQADRGIASELAWRDPSVESWLGSSAHYWNVTATSISTIAGAITLDDLRRGRIDHALAFATNSAAADRYVWPAQRTDGRSTEPDALPEGAHLRIDPSLDLSTISITPMVRMMAEAVQKYGMLVRDTTGSVNVFSVEQPRAGEANPIPALLGGKYPSQALAAFPWQALQVLDAPSCSGGGCELAPRAVVDVDTVSSTVGSEVSLDTSRSSLDQPRSSVVWDLDGDGIHETDAGSAVQKTFTPTSAGPLTVAVKMTTRDGEVVTGEKTIDIAPESEPVLPPVADAQLSMSPVSLTRRYFYSYSSAWSPTTAVTEAVDQPAVPNRYRKLYSSNSGGRTEMRFPDPERPAGAGAVVSAYVECGSTRCLHLRVLDAERSVLAEALPRFGAKGWVSVRVPGRLSGAQLSDLRLSVGVRNAARASGGVSLRAVRVTLPAE